MNGRRSSTPRSGLGTSWRLPVLLGRAFGLRSRLPYPPGRCRIASCVEEPAKEREAIPSPEPETGGVRREGVRERGWVVVDRPEGIGDNLCDCFGVFLVVQEVGSDARWPHDRHPVKNDPLAGRDRPVVEPDVGSAGLPPLWQREPVPVCGQVAKAVQRRSRTVGYDPLLRCPFPRRNLRGELEPRRTKVEMIWRRRPSQPVYAMRYPVKDVRLGEPLQRSLRDTGTFGLAARDEPPLILGDPSDAAGSSGVSCHYCIIAHI